MSWKLNSKLQTGRLGWGAGLGRPAFAPKIEFVEAFQADFTCPVLTEKIFHFACRANHLYKPRRPASIRGALAIVTNAGRDAVDAGGAFDESAVLRTAKSCGPDAPTLASSW